MRRRGVREMRGWPPLSSKLGARESMMEEAAEARPRAAGGGEALQRQRGSKLGAGEELRRPRAPAMVTAAGLERRKGWGSTMLMDARVEALGGMSFTPSRARWRWR